MQQRGLTLPMPTNLTPITILNQVPMPTFIPETKNHDQTATIHLKRKRREGESTREPPAKSTSCTVRNQIEKNTDRLERYEVESEKEGTSLKAPVISEKTSTKDEGVAEKLEKLKEELLAELKN